MNHKEFVDCLEEGQRLLDKDAAHKKQIDDLRERVRILREALEECVHVIRVEGFSGAAERHAVERGDAALEQTK